MTKRRLLIVAPPVGPFGYIVACHHLALPFNMLCSPVQALPALIGFASQTCAPILLSQTSPLGQQGEPQKKRERLSSLFFVAPPVVLTDQSAKAELVRKFAKQT